jgi:Fic family protein
MFSEFDQVLRLWQSYNVKTETDIDLRLHHFRILFAYNSGKIENQQITFQDTRAIFENGQVQGFTGDPRALFEQQNQKLCFAYLKPLIVQKVPLSLRLIREVHRILTSGTYDERRYVELGERPGSFKKHDFVTGVAEVGSLPEDVDADMQALLDEISENEGKDVLKLAAWFHLRFEYIHPFADGNGRVGRTLMNYYLMIHAYPPIIIHDEDKGEYYEALQRYDQNEEIEPMYSFLMVQAIKTWKKTLERERRRKGQYGSEI